MKLQIQKMLQNQEIPNAESANRKTKTLHIINSFYHGHKSFFLFIT